MRNVNELERAWMRYKLRSYLPKALGTLFIFLIVIAGTVYIVSKDQDLKTISETLPSYTQVENTKHLDTTAPVTKITPVKRSEVSRVTASVTPLESPVQLSPSLGFIASMDQTPEFDNQKVTSIPDQPAPLPPKTANVSQPQSEVALSVPKAIPEMTTPEETSKISINTHQDEEDIKEVIERFKVNKKPALSLFVAKRYYTIGRYRESYNYALITNDIDSGIEESWLIAAKSLVKLNEKDKALNLLTQFIDRTFSVRAKMLLDQINNGTLE